MATYNTVLMRRQPGGNTLAIVDESAGTGAHYYVHSGTGAASNDGLSPDTPLATIQQAIDKCVASQGDKVWVMPGHAETISAAAGIDANEAGISIIGIGNGSNRPTVTFSAVASTFAVTAANVRLNNIRVTATAATTKLFHVTAAGCTIDKVDYVEGSAIPLQFLLTSAASDQLTVQNCYHRAATTGASAQLWIELVGCDDARILDNVFHLVLQNGATCATINASTAVVNCQIGRNIILQTGGTTQVSAILLAASSTGFVHDNRVAAAVTTLAGIVALASAYGCENYTLNTANKSGILDPVADS